MQHGAAAVFTIGLRALGYPPSWANCAGEYMAIKHAVEAERNRYG